MKSDCIFVLLSINGRKLYFPLLYYISKIRKLHIYHDVIGGGFVDEVRRYGKWVNYVNSFEVNWVEMRGMREELNKLGVNNVEILPNFKRLRMVKTEELNLELPATYEFCMFSRITKEKGILLAAKTIKKINNYYGKTVATLSIYGEIDENFKKEFSACIDNKNILYKGVVKYNKSVQELKKYFMLLFPTTYEGEAFPGTILDAFCSGIPVIASNWHYNEELVIDKVNGYIYHYNDEKDFYNKVFYAINNSQNVILMKENCLKKAEEFKPDRVMKIVEKKLDKVK